MAALTITTLGHNLFRDALSGTNSSLVKYVALGTGTTAPAASDTKLVAEAFRKAVTSYAVGATGEELINLYLSASDAVGLVIGEVGIFGGNTATASANSGVLIGRGLYSHTHLSTESIQLVFDLVL